VKLNVKILSALVCLFAGAFVYLASIPDPILRNPAPRLVFLIATCTLNRNYLSPYNGSVRYTPNFEAFARQSIVFARHETEVGFSGPAYASLFSGSFVYHHGVYFHPAKLRNSSYLISEMYRDKGYETFFENGHAYASLKYNYSQGIRPENIYYIDPRGGTSLNSKDPNFVSILKRLQDNKNYKAYIQTNFTITHAPYSNNSSVDQTEAFCKSFANECPGIQRADLEMYVAIDKANHPGLSYRFDETVKKLNLNTEQVKKLVGVQEATYKSSVHLLDQLLGETIGEIRKMKLLDQSLIVFTSDHGEFFYKENSPIKWTHWGLALDVIQIPLIIRLPNASLAGTTYLNVTRSIDILPTLAGLSRIRIPETMTIDGADLSPALFREKRAPHLVAYSCAGMRHPASYKDDPRKMAVQARDGDTVYRYDPFMGGSAKYQTIYLKGKSFWDNLNKIRARKIRKNLLLYRKKLISEFHSETDQSDWDDVREQLRSMGYLH
jgi:arylsulfatase A-like enzyme